MWRDVINLVAVTNGENVMGDPIETETSRQVFANKKSIRQTEFYQAASTGLKPEIMFEIRSIEYFDEPKLEYENKTYTIIRTYSKNGEILELICSGLVNGVK
jgi:SPP1 family predicted phage head-tail adaptor